MTLNGVQTGAVVLYLITLQFQVLRNLSTLYYGALLIATIVMLAATSVGGSRVKYGGIPLSIYLIFLFYTVWICIWSIIYNSEVDLLNTVGRLFFVTTLPLLILFFRATDENIAYILRVYVVVYVIASWSYIFQVQFGAVEWFSDEPMERGSVLRYSTTLGSGNIYGIGVGVALLLASVLKFGLVTRSFIICSLMMGSILSMQKASLVNVVVWAAVYILIFDRKIAIKVLIGTLVLILLAYSFAYQYPQTFFSMYFQEFVFNSIGINLFDNGQLVKSTVLDSENLVERLLGVNTIEIMQAHDLALLLTMGIGTTGAGGGMGMPEYPQAHSTYWDLLFMGGFGYLVIYLSLLASILYKLYAMNSQLSKLLFWSVVLFSINAFAASAAIFHPILALPVWIGLLVVSRIGCNR